MKKFEKIYDILFTPVEKMTDDQVKFLEKVLDVNKKRKLKPWCVLGNLILTASIITTMVLTCTTLPSGVLPILICSAGTAASGTGRPVYAVHLVAESKVASIGSQRHLPPVSRPGNRAESDVPLLRSGTAADLGAQQVHLLPSAFPVRVSHC